MIQQLAGKYVAWMIKNGADEKKRAIYEYGVICILNETAANILLFTAAGLLGKFVPALLWLLAFMPGRTTFGGYHFSRPYRCIIFSTLYSLGCVLILPGLVNFPWLIFFSCLLSLVAAFTCAPVIHAKHPLSPEQVKKFRFLARVICLIEVAVILLCLAGGQLTPAHTINLGLFSAAVFCVIGKWKR